MAPVARQVLQRALEDDGFDDYEDVVYPPSNIGSVDGNTNNVRWVGLAKG